MSKIRRNRPPASFLGDYWWNLINNFFFRCFYLRSKLNQKTWPTVFWKFCILQSSFPPSPLFCILQPTSLVAVISTFLTKSMSSSSCWFLFLSSTESSLFSMLADVDLISFLISRKLLSWSLLVFDGECGGLVFRSYFGPILFDYNRSITKSVTLCGNSGNKLMYRELQFAIYFWNFAALNVPIS